MQSISLVPTTLINWHNKYALIFMSFTSLLSAETYVDMCLLHSGHEGILVNINPSSIKYLANIRNIGLVTPHSKCDTYMFIRDRR